MMKKRNWKQLGTLTLSMVVGACGTAPSLVERSVYEDRWDFSNDASRQGRGLASEQALDYLATFTLFDDPSTPSIPPETVIFNDQGISKVKIVLSKPEGVECHVGTNKGKEENGETAFYTKDGESLVCEYKKPDENSKVSQEITAKFYISKKKYRFNDISGGSARPEIEGALHSINEAAYDDEVIKFLSGMKPSSDLKYITSQEIKTVETGAPVKVAQVQQGDYFQFTTVNGTVSLSKSQKPLIEPSGMEHVKTKSKTAAVDKKLAFPELNPYSFVCVLDTGSEKKVLFKGGDMAKSMAMPADGDVTCQINMKKNGVKKVFGAYSLSYIYFSKTAIAEQLVTALNKQEDLVKKLQEQADETTLKNLVEAVNQLAKANTGVKAAYDKHQADLAKSAKDEAERQKVAANEKESEKYLPRSYNRVFYPAYYSFDLAPNNKEEHVRGRVEHWVNYDIKNQKMVYRTDGTNSELTLDGTNVFFDETGVPITTIESVDHPESYRLQETIVVCPDKVTNVAIAARLFKNPAADHLDGSTLFRAMKQNAVRDPKLCEEYRSASGMTLRFVRQPEYLFCYKKTILTRKDPRRSMAYVAYVPTSIETLFDASAPNEKTVHETRSYDSSKTKHPFFGTVAWTNVLKKDDSASLPFQRCVKSKVPMPSYSEDGGIEGENFDVAPTE